MPKQKIRHGLIEKTKIMRYGGLDLRELWKAGVTHGTSVLHVTMPPYYRHNFIYHAKTHEWFFVLKGSTTVIVGSKPRKLRPGSFIYMAPGVPHLVKAGKEAVEVLAFFSPPMNIKKPDIVNCVAQNKTIKQLVQPVFHN